MSKHDYYLTESEKISTELKRLLFIENGWELKKNSKTCKVYSVPAKHGDNSYVWKGEGFVPIKAEKIIDMVHPTEKYRVTWDPNIASCTLIEELSPNQLLAHQIMKSHLLGLLSARDSIDVFKLEEKDEYYSSQFGSVDHDGIAPPKDCIRAWSYPSGIFIFKNQNPSDPTRIVTFFQVDGKLDVVPPAVLNAAMPTFVKGYFKALAKTAELEWKPLGDVPGRRQG